MPAALPEHRSTAVRIITVIVVLQTSNQEPAPGQGGLGPGRKRCWLCVLGPDLECVYKSVREGSLGRGRDATLPATF